ncbi:uncharacterized protein DS421_18g620830 [Arachis hypogaea]|nr:uncharacterized protein DS421_18g620830 [Arachis hypogaea]
MRVVRKRKLRPRHRSVAAVEASLVVVAESAPSIRAGRRGMRTTKKGEEEERMVVGVFLAVTIAVVESHRRRRERRRSLLALLLGVWREWPRSASASGFCKLLESSATGN